MRWLGALLAGALMTCALVMPGVASATPRGHLSEAEYRVLEPAYERAAKLGADATPADLAAMCEPAAPLDTPLLVADHRVCTGTVLWLDQLTRMGACEGDGCFVWRTEKAERATRRLARLVRAELDVLGARGITGTCRRAFGSAAVLRAYGRIAGALRDLRYGMLSGDERGVTQALWGLLAITDLPTAAETLAFLRRCPRA